MTTPKRILDQLELSLGPAASPISITSAIEVELVSHFAFEPISAGRAEAIAPAVAKLIGVRNAEADDRGVHAILVIIGATFDRVAGACHILPTDDPHIAAAKAGRLSHSQLLTKIRSLTFAEFEQFGKRVLDELGALNARVTPHGGDQGIDFFGTFSLGQLHTLPAPFLKLAHDMKLLFAGQAKHYPASTIGPNIIRELIGAVSLARTKTFSTDGLDIFKELDIRPFSPVVAILFTTGNISRGAYALAASAGIVAKSGDQLAAFLADRGVGVSSDIHSSAFDDAMFDQWLHSSE